MRHAFAKTACARVRQTGMPSRVQDDNLEVAQAMLEAAPSDEIVVAIVRDFVASEPGARDWIEGEIQDARDVANCAVDLARARLALERPNGTLDRLEVLFGRACVRLAALLDRKAMDPAATARRVLEQGHWGRRREAR